MAPGTTPSTQISDNGAAGSPAVVGARVACAEPKRAGEPAALAPDGSGPLLARSCEVVCAAFLSSDASATAWLGSACGWIGSLWPAHEPAVVACVIAPDGAGGASIREHASRGEPALRAEDSGWVRALWSHVESSEPASGSCRIGGAVVGWGRFERTGTPSALVVGVGVDGRTALPKDAGPALGSAAPALARAFHWRFVAPQEHRETLISKLSPAQWRVARLLVEGKSEREVAAEIERSVHTVHDHAKAVYRAWGVRNRRELWERWG